MNRTDRISWCLVCNQLICVDDYHECLDGPERLPDTGPQLDLFNNECERSE